MKKWIGTIQVLAAGAGFGFLGIFGRWAFAAGLSVGELLFWRFVFAAIILWTFAIFFKRQMIQLKPGQILTSSLLGLFGYAVFSNLYFVAIQGMSIALAAMLLFTFPIFVSVGAHFVLKDRMLRIQWLSLAGAVVGMVILLWGDIAVKSLAAAIAGLGAATTYAIYVLVSGRVQKNVPALSSSLYVITAAAIGQYVFHRPDLGRLMTFSPHQLQLILGIAVIGSIAPMTLFLAGLQKMKSSQASILVMIEPVVAAAGAWILLDESLSFRQICGALIILVSIFLNSFRK